MAKVARYVRVSTTEQADRKTYETQIVDLDRYCEFHGHGVYDTYIDDGVSGVMDLEDRPEGARMMRDARDGKFDMVLCYKIDRLGRSVLLVYTEVDKLIKMGVEFATTSQPINTSNNRVVAW
jgi:site-specific DNA recombinase